MDSNNIGSLFKGLRKSKNLSLSDVSGELISLSFISKFERGESEISLSRFLILLSNLNVTIDEFFTLYENEHPDEIRELMTKVVASLTKKDVSGLKSTQQEEKEKYRNTEKRRFLYNSIMVNAFVSDITNESMDKKDIQILTDFLFGVEYWGNYELMLLGNSMASINIESLNLLIKEVITKSEDVANTESNYILIIDLLLNAINNALKLKRIDYAEDYLIYLGNYNLSSVKLIHEKIVLDFFKAILKIINENDNTAKKEITNIFQALEILSLENILDTLEKDYEYLKQIYHI